MKIKVSDYIADFISERGIKHMFTVTGGGAMHLNESFGHHKDIECTYHHHEQAAAMAAEAYARYKNIPAAVCITCGPGATNAITGVLCAWMESIPMLVFSGQVRYATTVESTGLSIRCMGIQEYPIVDSVRAMTKYSVMIKNAKEIRYCLEKAFYMACSQRPGPVWLDIPLDVQSAVVETEELKAFDAEAEGYTKVHPVTEKTARKILEKIYSSKRPLLFAGNGIHLAGAEDVFRRLKDRLRIPVVTGMSSVDLMETEDELYVGRSGITGNRAGNFAIQNSDCLLSLGSRQSIMQTGFHYQSWARAAYTILNDIDGEELKKPNLHVDMAVCADVKDLMEKLLQLLEKEGREKEFGDWHKKCRQWKETYPVVSEEMYKEGDKEHTNIYLFFHEMTKQLKENAVLVVSCGTSRVAGSQTALIKRGQRFITNSQTASMGYGLPAAIGVSIARKRGEVICVTGEGSLQMNLQELQTIVHNRLPIKIFVIDNEGYHSIRQTQSGFFQSSLIGIGPESGDLSFPCLEKIAAAYGLPYSVCKSSRTIREDIERFLSIEGGGICRVLVGKEQRTQPKVAARRLKDGSMHSATLENMYPFLSEQELKEAMVIPLWEEKEK